MFFSPQFLLCFHSSVTSVYFLHQICAAEHLNHISGIKLKQLNDEVSDWIELISLQNDLQSLS